MDKLPPAHRALMEAVWLQVLVENQGVEIPDEESQDSSRDVLTQAA